MAKKKSNAENAVQNIGDALYCFKINEAFESDQDTIAFFWLCIYENYMDKAAKYDKVDVEELNDEIISAFPTWEIEANWKENNFVTGRLADRKAPGGEKVLRLYNGYMGWMLIVEFENMEDAEKKTVVALLQKYYNHVTSDFDKKKAMKKRNEAALEPDPEPKYDIMDVLINGNVCREYLEDFWDVSSYDEGEYGADCSAEFILLCDSFLVWFKEAD